MPEHLSKLRPDRDLQCYFERPSAVAALSETSATGFTVSGCWRQQFDWVVIEWNRDNVFEHPALRNLPDGNLSGLLLSYEETRTNCIPLDSKLFATVDWPSLRIWAESAGGNEILYKVPLKSYATPTLGDYVPATAQFDLIGTPGSGDRIELAWLDQHFNYVLMGSDTATTAIQALADIVTANQGTGLVTAAASANRITLTYLGMPGHNGNRVGAYGTVQSAASWSPTSVLFGEGTSPQRWKIELDFGNLHDETGALVPTSKVRKMRWTWAADLQASSFARSEFSVVVSNWQVTGTGAQYQVAGPGSRRIEDDAPEVVYNNPSAWPKGRGNYSGGSIRWTATPGAWVRCVYSAAGTHTLYLGTRCAATAGHITVQIDTNAAVTFNLSASGEDFLVRIPLGSISGGQHTVTATHSGAARSYVYFDFLEIAYPTADLPVFDLLPVTTLATDWDTDHSIALAPERTAWLMHTLGFHGRANHYAGALWFYELSRPEHHYASATITFTGAAEFGKTSHVSLGPTVIAHVTLSADTATTIAKCFELLINVGSTGVWAQASGSTLTITSRTMGAAGNGLAISVDTDSPTFTAITGGSALAGGGDRTVSAARTASLGDGKVWQTDLDATPRVNRAVRDWSRSFFRALKGYGIDVATALSMELQHGDDSVAGGVAQRYPNGDAAWLNTPAVQTNFSPVSTAFWKQAHLDMANVMVDAAITPYIQFGEVQWWYFAAPSGMPFYDDYTKSTFLAAYGHPMAVIASQNVDPSAYSQECAHLPALIGAFTDAIMAFVRASLPDTRFEVLYPPDVNDTPLNRIVNFPASQWTPSALACLKTENFTYTGDRDVDKAQGSINLPLTLGFPRSQCSHLVGIGEYTTPWEKEQRLALGEGIESVVLFALDQFCLVGYDLPLSPGSRRAVFLGD